MNDKLLLFFDIFLKLVFRDGLLSLYLPKVKSHTRRPYNIIFKNHQGHPRIRSKHSWMWVAKITWCFRMWFAKISWISCWLGSLGLDEYVNVKSNIPTIVQYDFNLSAYKRNHVLLDYVFIIFKRPLKRHLQSCQISNVHLVNLDNFAQSCQHEKGELKQVTWVTTYSPFVCWWNYFPLQYTNPHTLIFFSSTHK